MNIWLKTEVDIWERKCFKIKEDSWIKLWEDNTIWVLNLQPVLQIAEFDLPKWPTKSLFIPKKEVKLMLIDAMKHTEEWEKFKEGIKYES